MAFCATCGAPVEGRFCGKCGSAVVSEGAPPAGAVPTGPGPQPVAASAPMADNLASALCYSLGFITGIIFLVLAPYNQNRLVKFHAFQSIFFSVAALIIRFAFGFVVLMLDFIGLWGLFFLSTAIGLGFFILWLYLLISTYQGKRVELPVIGPIARQQAGL
jgi:uncharacterized membrane protein